MFADLVACCKINGALYAPWMAFPLPASIIGRAVPEPPPAPLPVPDPPSARVYRIDDGLFSLFAED